jgi:carbamoyltransferase
VVWILGVNAHHADAAACLLRSGEIVAAAEEERFRRLKHVAGFPSQAIAYCLQAAGIGLGDVDHLAVNRDAQANRLAKLQYLALQRPSLGKLVERLRSRAKLARLEEQLQDAFPDQRFAGRIHRVQHHLAHMASAALVSPFDECAALSIDQFGDFESAAWGVCRNTAITIDDSIAFPHSLGTLYTAISQWLGFDAYGEEYKVMGLAAYGEPQFRDAMRKLVDVSDAGRYALDLRYFRHHKHKIYVTDDDDCPQVGALYSDELEVLLGPKRERDAPIEQRHRDIACSLQHRYEEALFALLRAIHAAHPLADLALAGGCALNAVANGKIPANTPFRRVFVQPAAGDAGGALGAALVAWFALEPTAKRIPMDHAFLGPSFSSEEVASVLDVRDRELRAASCEREQIRDPTERCQRVAEALDEGSVVAWFQGRMEWGPRALGQRSLLADPRRSDMRERLNAKVKQREAFRPFAPSVMVDRAAAWFECEASSPFMTQTVRLRTDRAERLPAITHIDGSARIQTVDPVHHALFYQLIAAFEARTGVPMLLNTSLNANEPIVCTPNDAIDCFLRTGIDLLVMEDHLIARR